MFEGNTRDTDVFLVDGVGDVEPVTPGHGRGVLPSIEFTFSLVAHPSWLAADDVGAVEGDAVGAQREGQWRAPTDGRVRDARPSGRLPAKLRAVASGKFVSSGGLQVSPRSRLTLA